eukprot:365638-Chlamydomonas_euryale.AAC.9
MGAELMDAGGVEVVGKGRGCRGDGRGGGGGRDVRWSGVLDVRRSGVGSATLDGGSGMAFAAQSSLQVHLREEVGGRAPPAQPAVGFDTRRTSTDPCAGRPAGASILNTDENPDARAQGHRLQENACVQLLKRSREGLWARERKGRGCFETAAPSEFKHGRHATHRRMLIAVQAIATMNAPSCVVVTSAENWMTCTCKAH